MKITKKQIVEFLVKVSSKKTFSEKELTARYKAMSKSELLEIYSSYAC